MSKKSGKKKFNIIKTVAPINSERHKWITSMDKLSSVHDYTAGKGQGIRLPYVQNINNSSN